MSRPRRGSVRGRGSAAASGGSVRFEARVTPGATADQIIGVVGGILAVRVSAAPIENAANASLQRLLARELDVPPSAVRLIAGATGRLKIMEVAGIDRAVVSARWPGLLREA